MAQFAVLIADARMWQLYHLLLLVPLNDGTRLGNHSIAIVTCPAVHSLDVTIRPLVGSAMHPSEACRRALLLYWHMGSSHHFTDSVQHVFGCRLNRSPCC
jgi:hypothetical protein